MGDVAGIGPEIVVKAVARLREEASSLTIIGSASILSATQMLLHLDTKLPQIVDTGDVEFEYGRVRRTSGQAALTAIIESIELLKEGKIDAVVTAPVNKQAIQQVDDSFTGHTEFFARAFDAGEVLMIAHSPFASFAFVTTHLPVRDVSGFITADRVLRKLELYDHFLSHLHDRQPRIAVLCLNPHCGEFSHGEEEEIKKAVNLANHKGLDASGPYPADTFHLYLEEVDGFLASYHDQGMIPAKMLARGQGVNVTWGLGFVRTSPLHGTAFDIAGKGEADPASMIAAIDLVKRLIISKELDGR